MSVRDLEVVRLALGAYGRGDLSGALSAVDEAFEIVDLDKTDARDYRGPARLRRWIRERVDRCGDCGFSADHFLETSDRVVVLCRGWWRDADTGARVERRFATAWAVEHGRIKSMEYVCGWEEALAARTATSAL
jgi:ketosteroid isomerase-like protein